MSDVAGFKVLEVLDQVAKISLNEAREHRSCFPHIGGSFNIGPIYLPPDQDFEGREGEQEVRSREGRDCVSMQLPTETEPHR